MRKHHPKNERIKRKYLAFLKEAMGRSEQSLDQAAASIAAFEVSTGWKDFAKFHIEQAITFKRQLAEQLNAETRKPLAVATRHARLMALRAFFRWLAGRQGYRAIRNTDAEYFNPSGSVSRIAAATREKPFPSFEQFRHVLQSMPGATDIEKRNRALIAFVALTGTRDNAVASLSLKHVDAISRTVFHDARTVRTKNSKTITSWFFPVGDDIEIIVMDWLAHLKTVLLYGPNDPVFPKTKMIVGPSGGFQTDGLERSHWATAAPIREIFKAAFTAAGLPYYNPHSLRDTLTQLGERVCSTPEEFKAWSQNLAHEKVLTTFTSYGAVQSHRQAEIIECMRQRDIQEDNAPVSRAEIDALKRTLAKLGER